MNFEQNRRIGGAVAVIEDAIDWTGTYRRKRSRMGDPLRGRRIRLEDGSEGRIDRASHTQHGPSENVFIGVTLDEKFFREWKPGHGYWLHKTWTGHLSDVTLLAAPQIAAPVRVRHVMRRGTKEQIAQVWATLPPLTDEQREAGFDRYIEFQPDVASYRRWRIVSVAPPLEQQQVDALPSEHPRAVNERSSRQYEEPEPSYGW